MYSPLMHLVPVPREMTLAVETASSSSADDVITIPASTLRRALGETKPSVSCKETGCRRKRTKRRGKGRREEQEERGGRGKKRKKADLGQGCDYGLGYGDDR